MNYKELLDILDIENRNVYEFIDWVFNSDYIIDNIPEKDWHYTSEELQKIGAVEIVFDQRINDIWKCVFHFKDHNVYLNIDCSYDSHGGIEYDYPVIYECRPREVTITVFDKIK